MIKKNETSIRRGRNKVSDDFKKLEVLTSTQNKPTLKKWWVLTAFGLIIAISIFGYLGYKNMVLAWVDNTPITKLTLYSELERKYGKEYTEQLISQLLITKEAEKNGIFIDETNIDQEIKKIEEQQGGAEQLKQAMDMQGISMTQLRDQIKYQLMIEKSFGKDKSVTDQEIKDYWEKKSGQTLPLDTLPATESAKAKEDITKTLLNEKISKEFQEWLSNNQKGERVTRLIYK